MAKKRRAATAPPKRRRANTGGKKADMKALAIALGIGALQNKIPDTIMEKTKGMAPALVLFGLSKILKVKSLEAVAGYATGRALSEIIPQLGEDDLLDTYALPSINGMGVEYITEEMSGEDERMLLELEQMQGLGVEYITEEMSGEDLQELGVEYIDEMSGNIVSISPDSFSAEYDDYSELFQGEGDEIEEISQTELNEMVREASMAGFLSNMRARVARLSRAKQTTTAAKNAQRYNAAGMQIARFATTASNPARAKALQLVSRRLKTAGSAMAKASKSAPSWQERKNVTRSAGERIVPDKLK